MKAEVTRESSLAGLGYSFSPLQLTQPCRNKQGGAECGNELKAAVRQNNAAATLVRFDLRARQPGARYGSPLGSEAKRQHEAPAVKQQQQQKQQNQTPAAGLARLKLASLSRRRMGQLQESSFEPCPEPSLPRSQSKHKDCSPPRSDAVKQQGLMDAARRVPAGHHANAKLPCQAMSGGSSSVNAKDNLLLRGESSVAADGIAAYRSEPEISAVEHGQRQDQQQQELSGPEMSHEPTIQHVHALLDSICLPTTVGEQLAGPNSLQQQLELEPAAAAVVLVSQQQQQQQQQQQRQHMKLPASLEEALLLLGLVPPHKVDCSEPSSACATALSSQQQQQPQQHNQLPLRPFMAPLLVKLAAVAIVLAAKQAVHRQELAQLLRRMGQTRMHLAYHQVGEEVLVGARRLRAA